MKKNTHEKGITLVALVITIIVMLILASVTINLIINGGLIEYARNAKDETIKEQEKEIISFALVEWRLSENVSFVDFFKTKFGATNVAKIDENTITVTIEQTGNKYVVSKDGNVELYNENEEGGEYTITYHKNDGTNTTYEQTATVGEEITLGTNTFTRDWYRLEGWYANAECTGSKITSVSDDADVYANWKVEKTITFDNNYNGTYTVDGGTVSVSTANGIYPTSYPSPTGSNTYTQNVVYINTGTINLPDHFEFSADLYFNNTSANQGGKIGVYLANTNTNVTRYLALNDKTSSLEMKPIFRFDGNNSFEPTTTGYNTYGTSYSGAIKITGDGTNMYAYIGNSQVTSIQATGTFTFNQIWIQFSKYKNYSAIPMGVKLITIRELD